MEKELELFHRNKGTKDGYGNYCAICGSIIQNQWKREHPEAVKKRHKKWRDNNRHKIRELNRIAYWTNSQCWKDKNKKYRQLNPEAHKESFRKWQTNNREHRNRKAREVVANLTDGYIRQRLKLVGIKNISPEMIQLKREQLKVHRALESLTEDLNNERAN